MELAAKKLAEEEEAAKAAENAQQRLYKLKLVS